ncbi:hypothetical protein ACJD0Z_18685 [Flavobacteriaceae bacterium M23B6Z8]
MKDPVLRAIIKIFASVFIALSGIILFTDKVFDWELSNTYGFKDSQTFIWAFTQTLSPLILAFGAALRPYRLSYTIPVYFYFIQLYWVFNTQIDDSLLRIYAFGCCIAFIIVVISIDNLFRKALIDKSSKLNFLEKALDLSIDLNRKS